ncbi:putative microtubule-associated protein [Paratrimastix pyriformis]|uniref:Microtubule-associated protein n=1 Tax=Paratrimastix pyriformis TaxID=342808 RepID=A0ABQ8UT06_9EUKA|nr:putative microtubule-associated protein [Paratrimastix pyriformis]
MHPPSTKPSSRLSMRLDPKIKEKFANSPATPAKQAKKLEYVQPDPKLGRVVLNGLNLTTVDGLSNNPQKIEFLYIRDNLLPDFLPPTPLLNLKTLDLGNNNITRLDFLRYLPQITTLYVNANHLEGFEGMPACESLEHLSVSENRIRSFRGMPALPRLKVLCCRNNLIETLEAFPQCPLLESVRLSGNPCALGNPLVRSELILLASDTLIRIDGVVVEADEGQLCQRFPMKWASCVRLGMPHPCEGEPIDYAAHPVRFFCEEETKRAIAAVGARCDAFLQEHQRRVSEGTPCKLRDIAVAGRLVEGEVVRGEALFESDLPLAPLGAAPEAGQVQQRCRWYRVDRDDVAHPVEEVAGPEYPLGLADVDHSLRFEVTCVLPDGTCCPPVFALSSNILPAPPRCLALDLAGEAREGTVITAVASYVGGAQGPSVYRWWRLAPQSTEAPAPEGAQPAEGDLPVLAQEGPAPTYALTLADVRQSIQVEFVPVRADGATGDVLAQRTPPIEPAPPVGREARVVGDLVEATTLRGQATYFGGVEGPSCFRWLRRGPQQPDFVEVATSRAPDPLQLAQPPMLAESLTTAQLCQLAAHNQQEPPHGTYLLSRDDVHATIRFEYTPVSVLGARGAPISVDVGPIEPGAPVVRSLALVGRAEQSQVMGFECDYFGGREGPSGVEWVRYDQLPAAPAPAPAPEELRDRDRESDRESLSVSIDEPLPSARSARSRPRPPAGHPEQPEPTPEPPYQLLAKDCKNYTPTLGDVGKYIGVRYTPVREDGLAGRMVSVVSALPIAPAPPQFTSVQLEGACLEGSVLVAKVAYEGGAEGPSTCSWALQGPGEAWEPLPLSDGLRYYAPSSLECGRRLRFSCTPVRADGVVGQPRQVISDIVRPPPQISPTNQPAFPARGGLIAPLPRPPTDPLAAVPPARCTCGGAVGPCVHELTLTVDPPEEPKEGTALQATYIYLGGHEGPSLLHWCAVPAEAEFGSPQERLLAEGSPRYTLTAAEGGCRICFRVTPVRDDGAKGEPQQAAMPGICSHSGPSLKAVRIEGQAAEGETLTCVPELNNQLPHVTTIRWYRDYPADQNLPPALLAETPEYRCLLEDVGCAVRVECSVAPPEGSDTPKAAPRPPCYASSCIVAPGAPVARDVALEPAQLAEEGPLEVRYRYGGGREGPTAFEWLRCEPARAEDEAAWERIPGADGPRIQLGLAEVGRLVRCRVTPVRADGARGAPQTVTSQAPVGGAVPTVSGLCFTVPEPLAEEAQVGVRFAYRGASRASAPSEVRLGAEEAGGFLRVTVTPVRDDGLAGTPAALQTERPVTAGAPTLARVELVREGAGPLTVRPVGYRGGKPGEHIVLWERRGAALTSADAPVPQSTDLGCSLRAQVTPVRSDGARGEPLATEWCAPIPSTADVPRVGSLRIVSANNREGDELTADFAPANCTPPAASFRLPDGAAPVGTGPRYAAGLADIGHAIRVRVLPRDGAFAGIPAEAETAAPIAPAPPRLTELRLVGAPTLGTALTFAKTYAGGTEGASTVEWERAGPTGQWAPIPGASGAARYLLTADDLRARVRVTVTAVRNDGARAARAAPSCPPPDPGQLQGALGQPFGQLQTEAGEPAVVEFAKKNVALQLAGKKSKADYSDTLRVELDRPAGPGRMGPACAPLHARPGEAPVPRQPHPGHLRPGGSHQHRRLPGPGTRDPFSWAAGLAGCGQGVKAKQHKNFEAAQQALLADMMAPPAPTR